MNEMTAHLTGIDLISYSIKDGMIKTEFIPFEEYTMKYKEKPTPKDRIHDVPKIPEIPIRLVVVEGSREENKANAEKSIRDALKILKFDMNPKIYIDFFNLLYDEWDDAIQAMDHIHKRIQFDSYLVYLLKKKNKR